MNIPIGDKYVITSDYHNLILNERVKRKSGNKAGEEYLRPLAYHTSLNDLVTALYALKIRQSDVASISDLAIAVIGYKQEILNAVPEMKTEFSRQTGKTEV